MKPKHFLATSSIGIILSFAPCITSCSSEIDAPNFPTENEKTVSMSETKAVSKADALDVAAIFNAGRFGGPANRSSQNVETITNQVGQPIAYVVNNDEGGWVIVSATTDYHPVLAYSDSGTFDMQGIENTGVSVWINEINSDIEASASFCNELTTEISAEWYEFTSQFGAETMASGLPTGNSPEAVKCRARLKELNDAYYKDGWTFTTLPNVTEATIPNDVYVTADNVGSPYNYTIVGIKDVSQRIEVQPMLETTWTQSGYTTTSDLAGCIPIAMGQIMKYHKYPADINWNNMPNNYANSTTQSFIDELRNIIGIDDGKTNATIKQAIDGFQHYGYTVEKKNHVSSGVINELTSRRPVFMLGSGSDDHAWVCDGVIRKIAEYKYYVEYLNSITEYMNYGLTLMTNPGGCGGTSYSNFHMNWGGNGSYDGWYIIPTPGPHDYSKDRQDLYVRPN